MKNKSIGRGHEGEKEDGEKENPKDVSYIRGAGKRHAPAQADCRPLATCFDRVGCEGAPIIKRW